MSSKIEKNLNNLADSLEISESAFRKAQRRYENLAEWLNRPESEVVKYSPAIYSQGSLKLGTAIKPINEDDEYDLDSVCLCEDLSVDKISQKKLKDLIGYEISKYVEKNNFKKEPDEGKRCWTIQYADSEKFHMDILPCVPDEQGYRQLLESHNAYADASSYFENTAIAITDNTHKSYEYITRDWGKSNPKGYHEWFKQKCVVKRLTASNEMFESTAGTIEQLPEHGNKLPLQKAIMILKRHRDIMFADDEHKPISIIITTLASHAYNGTKTIEETLKDIVFGMENYIQCDGFSHCKVLNPINPAENFADKWEEEPSKRENFFKWLSNLKKDYVYLTDEDISKNRTLLESTFGQNAINETYNKSVGVFGRAMLNIGEITSKLLSLPYLEKPNWSESIKGSVKIKCVVLSGGKPIGTLKSGEPISKGKKLRFISEINGVGIPLRTQWQIANTGIDAKTNRCLRGEFYDGTIKNGGHIREEPTAFIGEHLVRCFVIQHHTCVARSEPFIVNVTH